MPAFTTKFCWPLHPSPLKDECLSSWLRRVGEVYGLEYFLFCKKAFNLSHQEARCVDNFPSKLLLSQISLNTGVSLKIIKRGTLYRYFPLCLKYKNLSLLPTAKLKLQECRKIKYVNFLPWLYVTDVKGKEKMQFCVRCLIEDNIAYYRIYWQFPLMTMCCKHSILLNDICQRCSYRVLKRFHYEEIFKCVHCSFDLRNSLIKEASQKLHWFTLKIMNILDQKKFSIKNLAAPVFLRELHQRLNQFSLEACEYSETLFYKYFFPELTGLQEISLYWFEAQEVEKRANLLDYLALCYRGGKFDSGKRTKIVNERL